MVKNFSVLIKSGRKIGKGAIICMKNELNALDKDTLIIPVWYL